MGTLLLLLRKFIMTVLVIIVSLIVLSSLGVDIGPLIRFLEERGVQVTEARRYHPSLEDVFVQVTGIEAGLMQKEKEKAGGGGNQ